MDNKQNVLRNSCGYHPSELLGAGHTQIYFSWWNVPETTKCSTSEKFAKGVPWPEE
jgi:hypothetical protein